jgi:hypothetical protein
MQDAKDCSAFLGVVVAERVLSTFFTNIQRMPYGNPGYDFRCGKGFKIDVKSGCRKTREGSADQWHFEIRLNKTADYFLCLAFDNRESLNPEHVWLIPGNVVNNKQLLSISESRIDKWLQFEHSTSKVIICCHKLRGAA